MKHSPVLLRRGKAPIGISSLPSKWRHVPQAQRPFQGGQQAFQDQLLRTENDNIRLKNRGSGGSSGGAGGQEVDGMSTDGLSIRSPMRNFAQERMATTDVIEAEIEEMMRMDAFTDRRGYNDAEWYSDELAAKAEEKKRALQAQMGDGMTDLGQVLAETSAEVDGTFLPERIADNEFFKTKYGYDLVKNSAFPVSLDYGQLDMWAEQPQYSRDMFFLYVISRRRNTYAVCYDYQGVRLLAPYSVGNKGLKGGDRGFKAEGGPEVAHQVMSMYLNDIMPKIRQRRAEAGMPLAKGDKVDVVLRVLGFYNGRAGAVRAVNDRSDFFNVRYFEDVTPLPRTDGPRMPGAVLK